jgi:16S rRNA (guanine966-N2)-methyltransferase
MRIIAGERRGHKFDGPRGQGTRPTSDMVRESVFNILGDRVEGRIAVDLFAGTGALGLEALSRGAARAIFVEQHRENVALIHRNLAHLRYEDRGRVQMGDAHRWARSFTPFDESPLVVLIDPPYRDCERRPAHFRRMLAGLLGKLPAGSVVVLESRRALDGEFLPDLEAWDVRRYGGTQVAVRTATGPAADDPTHRGDLAAAENATDGDDHTEPGPDARPLA